MNGCRYWAIAALTLGTLACSSDPAAESWFAADPALTETETADREPTPAPEETASPVIRLPDDFPAALPRYPDATLLEVSTADAARGARALNDSRSTTMRWQTDAAPAEVEAFYTARWGDDDWQLAASAADNSQLVARRAVSAAETLVVQLSFPEPADPAETVFLLTYALEPATESAASPPAAAEPAETGASPAAFDDLTALDTRSARYIRDLAALAVIDAASQQFRPNQPITRREFARWLFAAHNQMYRDRPNKQIRPVTQVEQPAFEDVKPGDRGFAEIQGLAEAGIIPSRLTGDTAALLFQPGAPLTRAQAIAWKVPLDLRQPAPAASLAAIQQTWGFQDAEQLEAASRQALLADYENGDRANVLRAFGYTTLFQPRKPVTRAEAAAVLWQFGYLGETISAPEALALSEQPAEASEAEAAAASD